MSAPTTVSGLESSIPIAFLSNEVSLPQNINLKIRAILDGSKKVPGLESAEFDKIKGGIGERWSILLEKGVLEETATDKEIRPYFVTLQGIIEHVLAHELENKTINSLTGVIHTPLPATPLCSKGAVSDGLVHPSMKEDESRLLTVKARTTILRDYLYQGADLYIAYPKEGLLKRTEEQQEIYKNELANYPTHLFDRPLSKIVNNQVEAFEIDNDLVGAFYVFKDNDGKKFGFAIKMTQAINPLDSGSFCLWFDELGKTPVNDRISNVLDMLHNHSPAPIAATI